MPEEECVAAAWSQGGTAGGEMLKSLEANWGSVTLGQSQRCPNLVLYLLCSISGLPRSLLVTV